MNAIQITALHKNYGQVKALDGLDLEVPAGSVFGFLGPNGAGKTTTLRILAGLAKQTSGTVELNGQNLSAFQVSKLIGYLPEEPAFYPWMTPLEYLNFVGSLFGLDTKTNKARSEELLELTGLKEVRKRRIGGFSRGMRQRLGLAQALVNHPTVLLLDEPVSALDPMGRKEILEMIEGLGKDYTVVMSSHILADVERVCDTVAILNEGKRIIQADRNELMERYASPALELEFGNGYIDAMDEIEAAIMQLSSIQKVQRAGHVLGLAVKDIDEAQTEVLKLALARNWHFERLDVVKPSLEEVFVRLVEKKGSSK